MTQETGRGRRGTGIAIGLIAVLAASGAGLLAGSQRGHGGDFCAIQQGAGRRGGRQEGRKAPLLPQPDGPADTSPVPEEGPDGHGLHSGL